MSWRRLRTLMRREVLATFRDPFTITILIAVPLGAMLIFGFVLSTEVNLLSLGVLDESASPASRRVVSALAANDTFVPRRYETRAALDAALVAGEIGVGMIIPADFARDISGAERASQPQIQVIYDGGEATLAGNAEGYMRSIVSAAAPELEENMIGAAPRAPAPGTGVEVINRALFNARLDGKPFMIAGTFGFVLSFLTVLITAVSIVNEKLTGTFEQLQVTPATSVEILLGKILPLGAVFAFDVVLMVLVAGFVLNVWPEGSMVFFVLVSSFYVLVSLALGLFISATSSTAGEAVQKTVMLSIPLVQLSGFAFPIRSMPAVVRWISAIFPATHYIRLSRAIYLRGEGPLGLAPEIGLLAVFGVVLLWVALRRMEARG